METGNIGKKILVVGCPGSGKSTFAKELHTKTRLPLIHLDNLWWKADRTHISREEFDGKLAEVMSGDAWILDGNYSRTMETRFCFSDTVFFLDYPEDICMEGILRRIGRKREDLPWVETEPDPALEEQVRSYPDTGRRQVLELMERYPEKKTYVFRSRSEADAWLEAAGTDGSSLDGNGQQKKA